AGAAAVARASATAAGKVSPVVPRLLVVVMHGKQVVDGVDRCFLAGLAIAGAWRLSLLLHASQDELLLTEAGVALQLIRLEQCLGRLIIAPPLLEGAAQFPPGEGAIRVVNGRRLERAGRLPPDVGVAVAEPLIDERLALRRGRADRVLEQAEVGDDLAGCQS